MADFTLYICSQLGSSIGLCCFMTFSVLLLWSSLKLFNVWIWEIISWWTWKRLFVFCPFVYINLSVTFQKVDADFQKADFLKHSFLHIMFPGGTIRGKFRKIYWDLKRIFCSNWALELPQSSLNMDSIRLF